MSASVPADSAPEPSAAKAATEASGEAAGASTADAAPVAEPSAQVTEHPAEETAAAGAGYEEESSSPFRRRRDRPGLGLLGWIVIGVPAVLMAGGWAFIMAHVGQTPGISMETRTVDLKENAAVVTYVVGKPRDEQVRCVVDAFDEKLNVLVQREITVPKGASSVTAQETLPTPKKANGGRIRNCHKI